MRPIVFIASAMAPSALLLLFPACGDRYQPFVEYECQAVAHVPRGPSVCALPGSNVSYPKSRPVNVVAEVVERKCPTDRVRSDAGMTSVTDPGVVCPGHIAACHWVEDSIRAKYPGSVAVCYPSDCVEVVSETALKLGVVEGRPLNYPNPVDYASPLRPGVRPLGEDAGVDLNFSGDVVDASVGPEECDPDLAPPPTCNAYQPPPEALSACVSCAAAHCCDAMSQAQKMAASVPDPSGVGTAQQELDQLLALAAAWFAAGTPAASQYPLPPEPWFQPTQTWGACMSTSCKGACPL